MHERDSHGSFSYSGRAAFDRPMPDITRGNINLPTGNPAAFTGDGVVTGGPVIIADYRFGFGLLVAANTCLWLRPSTDFAGIKIGDMASVGAAAEQYVWQSKGISVIGEVYAFSVFKLPLTKLIGITQSGPGDWPQEQIEKAVRQNAGLVAGAMMDRKGDKADKEDTDAAEE